MKITHTVGDHRAVLVTELRLYRIAEDGEEITLYVLRPHPGASVMKPHQVWGIEAVYEAVDVAEREGAEVVKPS